MFCGRFKPWLEVCRIARIFVWTPRSRPMKMMLANEISVQKFFVPNTHHFYMISFWRASPKNRAIDREPKRPAFNSKNRQKERETLWPLAHDPPRYSSKEASNWKQCRHVVVGRDLCVPWRKNQFIFVFDSGAWGVPRFACQEWKTKSGTPVFSCFCEVGAYFLEVQSSLHTKPKVGGSNAGTNFTCLL